MVAGVLVTMASADVAAAAPAPPPPASGAPSRSRTVSLVCHGHSRPINYVDFSAVTEDGYFVISASKDGKPMLRNGESGDWIGTFEGHNGCVWGASLSGEATRAVTASADFSAKVWDALTGEELHSFPHKHIVRTCAFAQVRVGRPGAAHVARKQRGGPPATRAPGQP